MLRGIQGGTCFYCQGRLGKELDEDAGGDKAAHVDHFVPWARYPADLGHNFVLAHRRCNLRKSDHLAAEEHLAAWVERNETRGGELEAGFGEAGLYHSLDTSNRITRWAYAQTAHLGGMVWRGRGKEELVVLGAEWERVLG